ncbi:MAG: hypothetical protein QM736_20560 [Vicinamibacterales bacterium]
MAAFAVTFGARRAIVPVAPGAIFATIPAAAFSAPPTGIMYVGTLLDELSDLLRHVRRVEPEPFRRVRTRHRRRGVYVGDARQLVQLVDRRTHAGDRMHGLAEPDRGLRRPLGRTNDRVAGCRREILHVVDEHVTLVRRLRWQE